MDKQTRQTIQENLATIKPQGASKPLVPVSATLDESNPDHPQIVMKIDVRGLVKHDRVKNAVLEAISNEEIVAPEARGSLVQTSRGPVGPWENVPNTPRLIELASRAKAGNYLDAALKKIGIEGTLEAEVHKDIQLNAYGENSSDFSGHYIIRIEVPEYGKKAEALVKKLQVYAQVVNTPNIDKVINTPSGYEARKPDIAKPGQSAVPTQSLSALETETHSALPQTSIADRITHVVTGQHDGPPIKWSRTKEQDKNGAPIPLITLHVPKESMEKDALMNLAEEINNSGRLLAVPIRTSNDQKSFVVEKGGEYIISMRAARQNGHHTQDSAGEFLKLQAQLKEQAPQQKTAWVDKLKASEGVTAGRSV